MNDAVINQIDTRPFTATSSGVNMEERRLREACQKFEGMLLGMMMKEALRETPTASEGGAAAGLDSFREFCVEQVANTMAESSSLGIADQLYADLERGRGRYE